jgi:hypothetical protein
MTSNDDQYYNREKLYDEIWKEPMTVVCKRYGVSDVALAKTCGKLNIPHSRKWQFLCNKHLAGASKTGRRLKEIPHDE